MPRRFHRGALAMAVLGIVASGLHACTDPSPAPKPSRARARVAETIDFSALADRVRLAFHADGTGFVSGNRFRVDAAGRVTVGPAGLRTVTLDDGSGADVERVA